MVVTSKQSISPAGSSRSGAAGWGKRFTAASADRPWLAASVVFLISVLVRLVYLNRPPVFDEYYTLLAARGVLTDGIPRIADGLYDRSELYTRLVAAVFNVFGESFVVARLPSVLFVSLLVVAVFVWTRSVAGNLAAWIAALFLCFSPLSIEMSQFARFYALGALAFWLGAIGAYNLGTRRLTWPAGPAVVGAAAFALLTTWYLLDTLALFFVLGLMLWLSGAAALLWLTTYRSDSKRHWIVLGAVAALLLTVAAVGVQTGLVPKLTDQYLFVPMHMEEHGHKVWYYHQLFIERYPTFWPLFPFIALIALGARPKPVIFCLCIFCIAFLPLSFAGQKSWRYIFPAMPFLFVVWAIALAESWHALRRWVVGVTDRALDAVIPGLPRRPARWALVAVGVAFLIVSSGASARTLLLPLGIRLSEAPFADWTTASASLRPWVDKASVVLTTHELHALYHLGRYDIEVSKERLFELTGKMNIPSAELGPDGAEFAIDPRTGRPVVGGPEALSLILDCYPDGLIITDTVKGWRAPTVIDEATAAVIARRTTPIDVPAATHIKAFRWQHPSDGGAVPVSCAAVRELTALSR